MEEMVVERWLRVEPNERPLALRPLHVLAPDWGTDCRHFVDERLFFLPGEHELLDDALLQMDDVRRRAFASRPRGQPVSVILLMRQYFDAFSSLSTRLPMDEATCRLDFAWDFSALAREIDLRIVRHDAEFEKACVLYTIAAHQSLQAAKIRFVDVHSLWRRALLLQDAAELLQSAKGVMEAAGHVEWPPCFNAPVLDALSWTMAAEAFGCLFERRWKSDDSTLEDRLTAASETYVAYRMAGEMLEQVEAKQRYFLARHFLAVIETTAASDANFQSILQFSQRVVSLAKKADELMPAAFTDFYRHVQRQFAHLISTFKKQFTPLPEGARREAIAAEPAPALLDVRPAVFPLDEDAGDPFEFVGDWRKREEIRPVRAAVEAELRLLVGRLEKAAYDLYNDSVIYALFVEDLREKTPLPALIEQKRELLVQSGGPAAFADRAKMLEEANTKMKQVVDYFVYNVEEAAAAGGPPAPQSVQKKLRKMQRNLEKSCKWMDDLRARVQATMCGLEVLGRSKEELSAVIPEWRDDVQPILSEGDVHELRDQVTAVYRVVDKADELIYESNKVFWTDEPVEFATFDEWKAAVERQHAAAADLTTAAEEQLTAAANVRPLFAATVERLAAEGFRPELSDRHAHLAGLAHAFIGASHLQRAMDEGFRVLAHIIASFRSINPAALVEAEEVVEVAEVVRSRG
ncbi:Apoptosis-linked interacting protein [Aphelenchoides fujianensis]|nr:Apoptosis-linked interacting protein [Aphelenchoides fujianensis]